jgi:DEAD/DEAH box helicase domain-containing protein
MNCPTEFRKFMDISFNTIDNAILKLCYKNGKQMEQVKGIKIQLKFDDNKIDSTVLTGEEKQIEKKENIITLDLETQFFADEVGGWGNIPDMKIAIVCIYSSLEDKFYSYTEEQVPELIEKLKEADLVVGFNNKNFDNIVLSPYTDFDLSSLPTLDILEEITKKLGHRIKLRQLAEATLDTGKSADGLKAVQWFREGKLEEVKKYCQKDVEITRDLFYFAKENGYLKYKDIRTGDIKMVEMEIQK